VFEADDSTEAPLNADQRAVQEAGRGGAQPRTERGEIRRGGEQVVVAVAGERDEAAVRVRRCLGDRVAVGGSDQLVVGAAQAEERAGVGADAAGRRSARGPRR
jgi:hypothetical protein